MAASGGGAAALAGLLTSAARWATILGVGGTLAQSSLYTGAQRRFIDVDTHTPKCPHVRPPQLRRTRLRLISCASVMLAESSSNGGCPSTRAFRRPGKQPPLCAPARS